MKAIGIILAGGNNRRMRELTEKRAVAAMPIAGSYRAIDFALSNMTNSGIGKVAVITQYNAKSLTRHLSSSKWWNFGRKQGGLFVFTPAITAESNNWYRGTADSLYQNIDFLKHSHEPYVVIASGDGVYKLDYNKVLEYHVEKRADITIVVKDMKDRSEINRFGLVSMTDDNRVTNIDEKPLETSLSMVSTGVYVIRRRMLIELLEKAAEEDRHEFVRDILVRYKNIKKIYAYELKDYWANISTVNAYFKTNMDFLKKDVRDYFFHQYPDVYSKVEDLPPAKYNFGAHVKNSLISSGCIVNGTIENSVLFKKVYVGNNAVIKNSIILNNAYIGDNAYIENCIVESNSTIKADSKFIGEHEVQIVREDNPIYM
ncbi:MAG: glucose-1-phosphate adenylyltransferase subunit GlgD [Lachnospiraceae bacterium]|jgi:glucose-1-phosphate adenylyltransferase|nr:glucose-1-phosphate adenylyltransferase subunit GlgD [Lachnospiraceae bacterium]MCH4032141.1 glucose-1-phosphate adenylyltransferase subunit GlgD [Lachnospiraceae bacterium]MCH4108981.1 glucose-1-phosphate adenylyltransferase subunit GlgD [Lachnospiraceae bacterium]MCI1302264.1 glucose-1-phosphate adenylyltransferase subunit GlgD [Lachnospiraceae bacterium]MCI1332483.1 glucose-1-phosphate adenylyltransferase subunit GlgD [Lachnospiraceae bacterium]